MPHLVDLLQHLTSPARGEFDLAAVGKPPQEHSENADFVEAANQFDALKLTAHGFFSKSHVFQSTLGFHKTGVDL